LIDFTDMHRIHDKKGLWGGNLVLFDSLPSTNQWVLDNAGDLKNGDVVRAVSQTAGRGRFQRRWFSPPGRCLTFSIALMPECSDAPVDPIVCPSAAVAVRSALEEHGISASLKWPNDVLVNGLKICGILAEAGQGSPASVLALGIGLNVNMTEADFSAHELDQPATSMAVENQRTMDIEAVLASLFSQLENTLVQPGTQTSLRQGVVEAWKQNDCLVGRRIQVQARDRTFAGDYAGMDAEGRLCLTDDSGLRQFFWSGDVSIRDH
jgi:BirA family biotin operon repressor/biotin-[acetyl-CoA-carboxylase] ligase